MNLQPYKFGASTRPLCYPVVWALSKSEYEEEEEILCFIQYNFKHLQNQEVASL